MVLIQGNNIDRQEAAEGTAPSMSQVQREDNNEPWKTHTHKETKPHFNKPYVSAATVQMFLRVNELQEGLAHPFVHLFRLHAYFMPIGFDI